jgi:hypothetical protein
MKIKEKIYNSIQTMNIDELWFLYEQIQFIEHSKHMSQLRKEYIPIEDILNMTRSSTGCWADTVSEERAERI